MQEKTYLRARFKNERKKLDIRLVSDDIIRNIRCGNFYKSAEHIMLFYPLKYEINLLKLLEDEKKFYFPRVEGDNLLVCPYNENCVFKKSPLNIDEPCTNPVRTDILDLVFVPALAVDFNNYRLGYGGGFYDRFLKNINAISVVPVCRDFVVEKLPHDDFDVPVDIVVTNT